MISTDFAPNENWDDAWLSLKLLFQPWKWQKGPDIGRVKTSLLNQFKISNLPAGRQGLKLKIFLFLTGRSALYFFLQALNLKKNSEILVQGFTCEAVVLPIIAQGLKPVYVDIETKTLSMDIDDLRKKITKQTKGLILQHTFGITPINRKEIYALAQQNDLFVVEDLAHGFDPKITFGKEVTLLLSFGRSKSFSSVHGGAIITSNRELGNKLRTIELNLKQPSFLFILRALVYKPLVMIIKTTYDIYLGKILHKIANLLKILSPEITKKEKQGNYNNYFNRGYPNALATLLNHQLNKFEQKIKNRALIGSFYSKMTTKQDLSVVTGKGTFLRFPILTKNRDQILMKTAKKNIFLGKWYDQVVSPKSLNLQKIGYKSGTCPQAEKICQQIINLPLNIDQQQAKKVIESIYGN